MPSWPDPDPDGAFALPPSLQTKTPAFERAARACQRYMPNGGLNVHAVRVSGPGHQLIPVTTGVFDDATGLVEVSGQGLAAGLTVEVAQG